MERDVESWKYSWRKCLREKEGGGRVRRRARVVVSVSWIIMQWVVTMPSQRVPFMEPQAPPVDAATYVVARSMNDRR